MYIYNILSYYLVASDLRSVPASQKIRTESTLHAPVVLHKLLFGLRNCYWETVSVGEEDDVCWGPEGERCD